MILYVLLMFERNIKNSVPIDWIRSCLAHVRFSSTTSSWYDYTLKLKTYMCFWTVKLRLWRPCGKFNHSGRFLMSINKNTKKIIRKYGCHVIIRITDIHVYHAGTGSHFFAQGFFPGFCPCFYAWFFAN